MTNKEYADSLRLIADFFEQHTEIEIPQSERFDYYRYDTKADMAKLARALGGKTDKVVSGDWFELHHKFGAITFRAVANRADVCEKRQIGTRPVPEQVLFARPAETIPAHEEPIYEWVCPDSLLGSDDQAVR